MLPAWSRRWWVRAPLRVLRVYVVVLVVTLLFADRLLFHPPRPTYRDGPEILKLHAEDGDAISAVYLPQEKPAPTILFSHGNAEDLGSVRPVLERFHALGFAVLAYDYEGYGTSEGKPSELGSDRSIDAAYDYLTKTLHVPPSSVLVYGRSLGGGPSVDLASRRIVGGLVLESTFVSAFRVVTHWPIFPFDRFENVAKLPRVHCPVLVLHGTADRVVPYWQGVALAAAANEPKQFWGVEGADHLELMARPGYAETLQHFAALVRASPVPKEAP